MDAAMKQVIQNMRTGQLSLADVPAPQVRAEHLLVRTTASLISAGTERMLVDFANKTLIGKARSRPDLVRKVLDKTRRDGLLPTLRTVMTRLDEPLPLGYSAAGVVTGVGRGLEARYGVGQRVALAGAGTANHAELNSVPAPLVAPVPDDVSDEEAAFGTVASIALHGVRNLQPGLGDVIAVIGVGLVGLLAIQLLALSGVRVVALDIDAGRLALARRLGAEWSFELDDTNVDGAIRAATHGRGADGILVAAATDSDEPLALAGTIARDRAKVCLVGKVGTGFSFGDFMKKELSLVVSRSYGPGRYDDEFETGRVKYPVGFVRWTESENLAECLRLMSRERGRRLIVEDLITHRFDIAQAEAAYEQVLNGAQPSLGVVLRYPPPVAPVRAAVPLPRPSKTDDCRVGVIGAGKFAGSVLLPALVKAGAGLHAVVTSRGMTAEHAKSRYGFERAGTDPRSIMDDPSIDAVVILTPHDLHAELTAAALAAGKAVFVEKPLGLTRRDLAAVVEARQQASRFFTVGFNRRFSPLTIQARDHLRGLPGPRVVLIRVNAGPAAEERDRVLGEMCHFVDLARSLVGAPIRSVQAVAATAGSLGESDVTATLGFADGSVATIVYTGLGDSSFPKELIEVYAAGTVVRIDDFRVLSVIVNGRTTSRKAVGGQDKGHKAEMAAFVAAVRGRDAPPIPEAELFETSLATIAVIESLQSGATVSI
jgi:predicted dehydrogenase/threonine dehydrogenase-like Zn-dependent dehydrogenase